MYKGTNQNQQRRVGFIKPADLAGGTEIQSPREQRANYRRAISDIIEKIKATDPKSDERKALALEQVRLVTEMKALPNDEPMKADLGELLIDELRKMMTRPQYEIAVKRARERFETGEVKDNLLMNTRRSQSAR